MLFSERDELETLFAQSGLTPTELADKGKRLKAVGDEIESLEGRWLELSTQIDALSV